MDEPNPYRSPEARIVDQASASDLAGLGQRLAAALLDGLMLLLINLPLMYVGGYFRAVFDAADAAQPAGTVVLSGSHAGRHVALAELQIAAHARAAVHLGSAEGPRLEPLPLPYPLAAEAE